jgi:hypothetical protein
MGNQKHTARVDALLAFLLTYGMASLLHHVHNATFLDEYPNMPAWLTPAGVYAAWFAVTLVGLIGYFLVRRGYRLAGLAALAIYGALGLDGLGHYRLAPLSAHTLTMNLTIWLEGATGVLLAIAAVALMAKGRT